MAKKQSLNIFEAHVEKLVLLIAVAVCVWVVVTRYVFAPGIKFDNETMSASEAVSQAADMAEEIKGSISRPTSEPLPPVYQPRADWFGKVEPLAILDVDRMPLFPEHRIGITGPEDPRTYVVSDIPQLNDVEIQLNHGLAWVPDDEPDQQLAPGNSTGLVEQDVDFVTLSAKFPWSKIKEDFQKSFAGATVEKPLENPDPVLAAVQLQRSRLMPDGSWSDWQTVSRLEVDPLFDKEMDEDLLVTKSYPEFEVVMGQRRYPDTQMKVIQPWPYDMVLEPWTPPTEEEDRASGGRNSGADREEKAKARREALRARQQQQRRQPGGMGGGGDMMMDMPGGMGMPGGDMPMMDMGMDMGMAPGGMAQDVRRTHTGGALTYDITQLDEENITVWAHDGQALPGRTYRYRIRLGIFNPIALRDWFTEQQQELKLKPILWTEFTPTQDQPEKQLIARIPERLFFVPKSTTGQDALNMSVEVYRLHEGEWHKKIFRITPGIMIGEKVADRSSDDRNERRSTAARDETQTDVEIDYRTYATVIDIVPGVKYWCQIGTSFKEVETTDLLFREQDGTVSRLSIDKYCWPESLRSLQTGVVKKMREQSKSAR